jgi:hypothetical protein
MNIGISGIWQHPQSTIPALLAGVAGIVVALGYLDSSRAAQLVTVASSVLITVIGVLYKGKD